jgi:hypothetical protein
MNYEEALILQLKMSYANYRAMSMIISKELWNGMQVPFDIVALDLRFLLSFSFSPVSERTIEDGTVDEMRGTKGRRQTQANIHATIMLLDETGKKPSYM